MFNKKTNKNFQRKLEQESESVHGLNLYTNKIFPKKVYKIQTQGLNLVRFER